MPLRLAIPAPLDVLVVGATPVRCREIAAQLGEYLQCVPRIAAHLPAKTTAQLVVLVNPPAGPQQRSEFFAACGETPVLVVIEELDDRRATEWILAGADDVLDASADETALGRAAVRVLARARRRAELRTGPANDAGTRPNAPGTGRLGSLIAFLQAAALTDPLTGLANRRALDERLERLWSDSVRDGTELSVLMIDVDDFKHANDRGGHAHGDSILVALATAIRGQCRNADFSARYGGDEVVVVLPHAGVRHAHAVAERIRDDFGARVAGLSPRQEPGQRTGLSIGIASRAGCEAAGARDLLGFADQALYAAKHAGKGCTRVCDSSRAAAV